MASAICTVRRIPEDNSYDCTVPILTYHQEIPQTLFSPKIKFPFQRVLRNVSYEKGKICFVRLLNYRYCNKAGILCPLPLKELALPKFEILPNDEIFLDGMKIPVICLPQNPEDFLIEINNNVYSLFVKSV